MFILTIESDSKGLIVESLPDIKKKIEEGYLEGFSFENHWEIKEEVI
jgi:hypothetical protein